MKFRFLLIIILSFFNSNLSIANNIAYLDLNYILNNSTTGKNLIKKLEEINAKNLDILKKEQTVLNKERDDIEKTKNILSKNELNNKLEILNDKLQKFAKKQDDLSNDFKNIRKTEMENFLKKINPIIENYMLENDIDLILKNESIYISKSDYNISTKIINLID